MSRPSQIEVVICQRCGRGFVVTSNYLDMLARRGRNVVRPVLCPTCFMKAGPRPKQHGEVKWFSPRKHYGFIVTDKGSEVFFHQRQIVGERTDETQEGQPVRFHVRDAAKGPEALNVEIVEE